MRCRAILFDFDGTLIPSLPLWLKAFREALNYYGITVSDSEVVSRCFYRAWEDVAEDFNVKPVSNFCLRVKLCLRQAFLEATLYPFARDVLIHCRKHGMLTALVTSSPREVVTETLLRLKLKDLFESIVSGDDGPNYKPRPEPLFAALDALGLPASEALMIGDSEADIQAGKAAGTFTALFTPKDHVRFNDADSLLSVKPDLVLSDFTELPKVLGLPEMRHDENTL
jgi:HAD superfamily hydrolase (TIGR01549 family)